MRSHVEQAQQIMEQREEIAHLERERAESGRQAVRAPSNKGKMFEEVQFMQLHCICGRISEHVIHDIHVHVHALSQVGERQKRRKLAMLRTCTASLLQPTLGSYGLTPTVVSAVTDKGTPITLSLVDAPGPSEAGPPSQSASPSQPQPIARILYLLDRYGVSDEFYHEMAQVRIELTHTHVYKCAFMYMYK